MVAQGLRGGRPGSCLVSTISTLRMNLQVASFFKDTIVPSQVQSRKQVQVSGVHCHVPASSISGFTFVFFPVQDYIEYSRVVF